MRSWAELVADLAPQGLSGPAALSGPHCPGSVGPGVQAQGKTEGPGVQEYPAGPLCPGPPGQP
ncbi:hypothetical protein P7K49_018919, partial [Saguinus oedipus]